MDNSSGSEDASSDPNQHADEQVAPSQPQLLQYGSSESSDSEVDLQEKKNELIANENWGRQRGNFYGRDKRAEESSENDEDENAEALRLARIRAEKLKRIVKAKESQWEEEEK